MQLGFDEGFIELERRRSRIQRGCVLDRIERGKRADCVTAHGVSNEVRNAEVVEQRWRVFVARRQCCQLLDDGIEAAFAGHGGEVEHCARPTYLIPCCGARCYE